MYAAATSLAGAQGIAVHKGLLLLFLIFTLVALGCSAGDRHLLLSKLYMQSKESIPPAQRHAAALCFCSVKVSSSLEEEC